MNLKLPERLPIPPHAYFLVQMEQEHLEDEIIETLTRRIPMLYQIVFNDMTADDLPIELHRLMERLAIDLDIDFEPEDDDDEEELTL